MSKIDEMRRLAAAGLPIPAFSTPQVDTGAAPQGFARLARPHLCYLMPLSRRAPKVLASCRVRAFAVRTT